VPKKLNDGEKHFLRLIRKDRDPEGWAVVSKMLYPLMDKMPRELVELRPTENGGRVRLTDDGEALLDAIEWL
jgi:hypothetical protein